MKSILIDYEKAFGRVDWIRLLSPTCIEVNGNGLEGEYWLENGTWDRDASKNKEGYSSPGMVVGRGVRKGCPL